jgi:hypothetical protein
VPPEADGPVFLSGVWCHVSPATDKVCGRSQDKQFRRSCRHRTAFAAYIKTGIERWAMIKKIRAPLK